MIDDETFLVSSLLNAILMMFLSLKVAFRMVCQSESKARAVPYLA
jgi:hypothetical protein